MKGIILAGGNGTRLHPLTISYSKQLIPVFDKPLIYYPLSTLISLNIKDILVIVKADQLKNFQSLLKNGNQFGVNISYAIQNNANGIAEALIIGKKFIKNESVALILGDNIFYGQDLFKDISFYKNKGSIIFLYQVKNPSQYGVARFKNNQLFSIDEKPRKPKSDLAVTGLYIFDQSALSYVKKLKPSKRGELEITDLNNIYIKSKKMNSIILKNSSIWFDAGTTNSLLLASQYVQAIQERNNILISSPEEISFNKKNISKVKLMKYLEKKPNNSYYNYLIKIIS